MKFLKKCLINAKLSWKPKFKPIKKSGESVEDFQKRLSEWREYKKSTLDPTHNWIENMDWESREDIPKQEPTAKQKGLNKLAARTKVRLNKGKREFLLIRTLTNDKNTDELVAKVKGNTFHTTDRTSWSVLKNKEHNNKEAEIMREAVAYVWIPEDAIVSIPMMYGNVQSNEKGPSKWRHEYEVIVGAGKFEIYKIDKTFYEKDGHFNKWKENFENQFSYSSVQDLLEETGDELSEEELEVAEDLFGIGDWSLWEDIGLQVGKTVIKYSDELVDFVGKV